MGYPVEDLATYLDGVLPEGVQVYGYPADIGKLPAVVLAPGDPAIGVTTQSQDGLGGLAWGIDAALVVSRSNPQYGIRAIIDLWRQVAAACNEYTIPVTVLTLEGIGDMEWGGEDALLGSMPMIIHTQGAT